MDLYVYVIDGTNEVCITLHDKRSQFAFNVYKFPHAFSNHSWVSIHNVAYGEIVRLFRLNTHIHLFIANVSDLFDYCVQEKCYDISRLTGCFEKFAHHVADNNRYRASYTQFIRLLRQHRRRRVSPRWFGL